MTETGGQIADVTLATVKCAQSRIRSYVHRAPLSRNATLSAMFGTNVYLKMEVFQRTGAFKVQGAFNKILSLDREKTSGVVAVSGGNHAQGVAYAARVLDLSCVILLPRSTPENYVQATRGYGAEVVFVSDLEEGFGKVSCFEHQGYSFIHPYADPLVIAGQGTLGLEIYEDYQRSRPFLPASAAEGWSQ